MSYKTITLKIQGISGLLMHNPAGSMTRDTTTASRSGKSIPTSDAEALNSLYVDSGDTRVDPAEARQLYLPADALREASLIASKSFRDRTRRGNASYEQRFSASVFLGTDRFPLVRATGSGLITTDPADWVVHTKRAVVQGQGIMRSRALITDWACTGEFEYDTDTITPEEIAMIVTQAGKFPGVLDYRPGKKGPFGRFELLSVNGTAVVREEASGE
jgi:hypothetical protein